MIGGKGEARTARHSGRNGVDCLKVGHSLYPRAAHPCGPRGGVATGALALIVETADTPERRLVSCVTVLVSYCIGEIVTVQRIVQRDRVTHDVVVRRVRTVFVERNFYLAARPLALPELASCRDYIVSRNEYFRLPVQNHLDRQALIAHGASDVYRSNNLLRLPLIPSPEVDVGVVGLSSQRPTLIGGWTLVDQEETAAVGQRHRGK